MNNQTLQKYKFEFDTDGYFESCIIPKDIGACPNCDSELVADAEEWETESKIPTTIKVDCIRDMECWEENEHSEPNRMPYVYWLPLEVASEAWVLEQLNGNQEAI